MPVSFLFCTSGSKCTVALIVCLSSNRSICDESDHHDIHETHPMPNAILCGTVRRVSLLLAARVTQNPESVVHQLSSPLVIDFDGEMLREYFILQLTAPKNRVKTKCNESRH